jgi:hypothetical protein
MSFRLLALFAVVLLAGCGQSGSTQPATPDPARSGAKPSALPPEVEFDPATATEKYQKNKKPKP